MHTRQLGGRKGAPGAMCTVQHDEPSLILNTGDSGDLRLNALKARADHRRLGVGLNLGQIIPASTRALGPGELKQGCAALRIDLFPSGEFLEARSVHSEQAQEFFTAELVKLGFWGSLKRFRRITHGFSDWR